MKDENTDIKECQRRILSIFRQVDEICKKYDLRYFAIGGTCLGAVRHMGFIPWDDDMDIAMPREDYEKFKKIAKTELSENLEIRPECQGEHNRLYFMKVYDNETAYIGQEILRYPECYTGVTLDIMPLDGIPSKKLQKNIYFIKLKIYRLMDYAKKFAFDKELNIGRAKLIVILGKLIAKLFEKKPANYFSNKYVKLQKKYTYEESRELCYTWSYRAHKVIFPKQDFRDYVEMKFEDTMMRCPIGYDNFLTLLYGKYMELPPIEQQVMCHAPAIIDFENSYKTYM